MLKMVNKLSFWKVTCCSVGVLVVLALTLSSTSATKEKCDTCRRIVDHFMEGLEKTKKSNFGGGNTRWEEKSLGSWAHSETRLVEIWDNYLCKDDGKECHFMLEKHEEDLEEFWFNVHAKIADVDMHDWFCINRIKVCCPSNTYGPKCKECTGGKERPCKGNGKCDGEGTRSGTGKCKCDAGYHGDMCDECTDGYFEENKNDTHTQCTACHMSCQSTCWEAGPKGCDECKKGWTMSEDEGCQDVDECPGLPCEENQYCTNTPGSYHCATCHRSCNGCHSYGDNKCEECKQGYKDDNGICKDINECEDDATLCTGDKQSCENTEGSYECKCDGGLMYDSDTQTCISKPKVPTKSSKSKENRENQRKQENEKPGLLIFLAMVVVFYVCGNIVQWNFGIVFCLSVMFSVFLYWFALQHDAV